MNFLKELKNNHSKINNKELKKIYNLDFNLVDYANSTINKKNPLNKSMYKIKCQNFKITKIDDVLSKNKEKHRFVALLLCGGKASRFRNNFKAVHEIKNLSSFNKSCSFLKLNILQIIKTEKLLNKNVPVIIYYDCFTYFKIISHLKKNNFFGKNPKDFYFIKQPTSLRYIPNRKILEINKLNKFLSLKEIQTLPKETKLFITKNIEESIVSDGHFIFNTLISSSSFRLLIKREPDVRYLVISNIDNLGQKYFSNLINSKDNKNYVLVCRKKKKEKMDGIFWKKKLIIDPYFICQKESNYGFTATSYIQINDILNIFGYKSRKEYQKKIKYKNLIPNYRWVLKCLDINGNKKISIHLEASLSEISQFIIVEAVEGRRNQIFYPFKSIFDFNIKYIKSLKKAIKTYKYL